MMRHRAWALLCLVAAGPAPADPDWPCVQRLVPVLTAATLWPGHDAAGSWRDNAAVAALVQDTAPRSITAEKAAARIDAFVPSIPAPDRPAALALIFTGLVEQTNAQRSQIVDRLRSITRRQRLLTDTTSALTAELRALPPDAPASQREEMVERRILLIREYDEIERTIRYACEVPVQMEAKLGLLAQALERGLSEGLAR